MLALFQPDFGCIYFAKFCQDKQSMKLNGCLNPLYWQWLGVKRLKPIGSPIILMILQTSKTMN